MKVWIKSVTFMDQNIKSLNQFETFRLFGTITEFLTSVFAFPITSLSLLEFLKMFILNVTNMSNALFKRKLI